LVHGLKYGDRLDLGDMNWMANAVERFWRGNVLFQSVHWRRNGGRFNSRLLAGITNERVRLSRACAGQGTPQQWLTSPSAQQSARVLPGAPTEKPWWEEGRLVDVIDHGHCGAAPGVYAWRDRSTCWYSRGLWRAAPPYKA